MNDWKHALRHGLMPLLSDTTLETLLDELEEGGHRLTQTVFVQPVPTFGADDEPAWEKACLIGYCAAIEHNCRTSAEVSAVAPRLAEAMNRRLNDQRASFVNELMVWFDGTPIEQARKQLAEEVRIVINERNKT